MVEQLAASFASFKEVYSKTLNKLEDTEERLERLEEEKQELLSKQVCVEKARAILQEIAFKTQQNLEYHVSSLVTTALKHVDPSWPDYSIEFVKRRNTTECDLFFEEKGKKQHPLKGAGGGAQDVAAFAQLISYWTLRKNNPIFILDEPFRNVSPDLQSKVSEMLKMVCEKLHLQIIMVSHAEDINTAADKTFYVDKVDDVSRVREV